MLGRILLISNLKWIWLYFDLLFAVTSSFINLVWTVHHFLKETMLTRTRQNDPIFNIPVFYLSLLSFALLYHMYFIVDQTNNLKFHFNSLLYHTLLPLKKKRLQYMDQNIKLKQKFMQGVLTPPRHLIQSSIFLRVCVLCFKLVFRFMEFWDGYY